ncbi:hypothetical protein CPC08DRAFT_729225 [Agrocybe pediades]|nr:hypothetical protein CPC08DRAFT_729225 [Agrocybe pediades]
MTHECKTHGSWVWVFHGYGWGSAAKHPWAEIMLADLNSIVKFLTKDGPPARVGWLHQSLKDFLTDPDRAGDLYQDLLAERLKHVARAITIYSTLVDHGPERRLPNSLKAPIEYFVHEIWLCNGCGTPHLALQYVSPDIIQALQQYGPHGPRWGGKRLESKDAHIIYYDKSFWFWFMFYLDLMVRRFRKKVLGMIISPATRVSTCTAQRLCEPSFLSGPQFDRRLGYQATETIVLLFFYHPDHQWGLHLQEHNFGVGASVNVGAVA